MTVPLQFVGLLRLFDCLETRSLAKLGGGGDDDADYSSTVDLASLQPCSSNDVQFLQFWKDGKTLTQLCTELSVQTTMISFRRP
jgi:hypothetical protein